MTTKEAVNQIRTKLCDPLDPQCEEKLLNLQLKLFRSAASKMDANHPGWSECGDAPNIDDSTTLTSAELEELEIVLANVEHAAA